MPVEAPLEFIPAPVNTVRFQELETGRDEANGKASLLQMVFGLHIMPVDCQRFEKAIPWQNFHSERYLSQYLPN
jgi:hypothetical protein